MHATLQDFLRSLEGAGELKRIAQEVSPILEVSALADLESKNLAPSQSAQASKFDPLHADLGGHALLFEKIEGCQFPLAIIVFGSYRRMELALGRDFESIAQRIASLTKLSPPRSFGEILSKAREFLPLLGITPKLKRSGICQQVVKLTERSEVNLLGLPLIKCWPLDGDPRKVGYDVSPEQAGTARGEGRYITFAGMHTIHHDDRDDPKPASHNIGMYRAQLIDETHLAMHWHMHHDGAAHWRSWKMEGKPMPIAIALGGEAVLPYAATAPLPPGMSELLMAGFLNGKGIPLVKCKTVPLRVPANSEIVIEGWVSTECGPIGFDPRTSSNGINDLGPGAVFEGPFGDHTGFYSLPDRYPIVNVTAITHRHNPVFPAIIVGLPPQEDYYLGKATERIFLPLLRTLVHDIVDYHLPMFGCFHNCAFVKIRKAYPLQARRIMHAIWGAGQMAWTKFIIVVDHDVDVHDEVAVLDALCTQCHFARDVERVHGPLDILDHAASHLGAGGKLGFDATRKIPGEEINGIAIEITPTSSDNLDRNAQCAAWAAQAGAVIPEFGGGGCVFLAVNKRAAGDGARAIQQLWSTPSRPDGCGNFVIAVNHDVDVSNWQNVLFQMCANVDPARDVLVSGDRIGLDATAKLPGDERNGYPIRSFPPIIEGVSPQNPDK
jgi:4-hydroxy-3-polyprenylbenzoate decarboxylase